MASPERELRDVELRCDNTLHGILLNNGLLEIKCHHIRCTKGRMVVMHYYDPQTGEMVDTKVYQDPAKRMKGRKQR